ncbi:MAG TPA: heat-inducible transcriptional repressor HrcA [Gemmatimonadaceae bacterium]|nr:heat-inducible transcriptional repressor HrcA [Gemmatimonadaceae bacterium]
MPRPVLSERERRVLEAVIQSYVETAEPAGSSMIARRFGLGVSPATIRNTMSDLEAKGFLFHPHTSAGRVPTDLAYRMYVDSLMRSAPVQPAETGRLTDELSGVGSSSTIATILRRAAQSLSVVAQELGVALGPRLDNAVLQKLELTRLSHERLLLVLTLQAAGVRTIFVEVRGQIADSAVAEVGGVLNERLAGLQLRDIRTTLSARVRDAASTRDANELLNIFVQEGELLFDVPLVEDDAVVLGQASVLAEQPEFASGENMRRLLAITDRHEQLAEMLRKRSESSGISITIGNEHDDPRMEHLTMVTASYNAGPLSGVIGVIGPTRMPYDKVIALVRHTSQIVSEVLQ